MVVAHDVDAWHLLASWQMFAPVGSGLRIHVDEKRRSRGRLHLARLLPRVSRVRSLDSRRRWRCLSKRPRRHGHVHFDAVLNLGRFVFASRNPCSCFLVARGRFGDVGLDQQRRRRLPCRALARDLVHLVAL